MFTKGSERVMEENDYSCMHTICIKVQVWGKCFVSYQGSIVLLVLFICEGLFMFKVDCVSLRTSLVRVTCSCERRFSVIII